MASRSVAKELRLAADAIRQARAIIVTTTGPGMGAGSGFQDFSEPQEFWKTFPALKKKGIQYAGMRNPKWFVNDPHLIWGFYGYKYNMFQKTMPHHGFNILKQWASRMEKGYFIYTSSIDGHFQKAGFSSDHIVECHGNIQYMQSVDPEYYSKIWQLPEGSTFDIDEETLECKSPLPCGPPGCSDEESILARPNVQMFGDWLWLSHRTEEQENRSLSFQTSLMLEGGIPFVVIEIGANVNMLLVRKFGEGLVSPHNKGTLIRINQRESRVPKGNISLPMTGLEALEQLDKLLK